MWELQRAEENCSFYQKENHHGAAEHLYFGLSKCLINSLFYSSHRADEALGSTEDEAKPFFSEAAKNEVYPWEVGHGFSFSDEDNCKRLSWLFLAAHHGKTEKQSEDTEKELLKVSAFLSWIGYNEAEQCRPSPADRCSSESLLNKTLPSQREATDGFTLQT